MMDTLQCDAKTHPPLTQTLPLTFCLPTRPASLRAPALTTFALLPLPLPAVLPALLSSPRPVLLLLLAQVLVVGPFLRSLAPPAARHLQRALQRLGGFGEATHARTDLERVTEEPV